MKGVQKVFGERLKLARERRGISLAALADGGNVAPSMLLRFEEGTSSPTLGVLVTIIEALKVDAHWLLGLKDDDPMAPPVAREVRHAG